MEVLEAPSVEEEAAKRKAEAKKHFDAIRKAGTLVSTSSLRIGWHANIMKKQGLFGILGFESEKDVWEAAGVGASTWYAQIRLAELFDGIDEESFTSMKGANAAVLGDLPLSKRLDPYWLKKAATESMDTFAAMVDTELDGNAKRSDGKERTVSMKITMPKSRKVAVEAGLKEISKEYGCEGDESRTLELLVAEKTGTPSLVGTITAAVQKLKEIKELCESGLSSDEVLAKVVVINEELILGFAGALNGVQNSE